jgi:hypothetical protein
MSAIADFRLIETSKLNDLLAHAEVKIEKGFLSQKTIDNYGNFLNNNSKKLKDFNSLGYVFADLLIFLSEEKGINLLKSKYDNIADELLNKRGCSTFILTFDHKQHHLDDLSPDKFDLNELIQFNKDFSEDDDPELAKAEMQGIKDLHDSLELLADDQSVVLLSIG